MAILDGVKNAFINQTLKKVLDGNTGSNILGVVILAIMQANINYTKAIAGFKFDNQENAMESAKLVGTVVVAAFAYFVGKKKAPLA
jgi:hypothetical protein